jgi:hypothetical protein
MQKMSNVVRLYYLKGATKTEHDFEPGELAERMQSAATSRLPRGTTCLVDVASDAISASYDMCFRKTKYDIIFIEETLEGSMAGHAFAEHLRNLGIWSPNLVMIVEDVRCIDESSLIKQGFDACISRPKLVVKGTESVQNHWNLKPLFDCAVALLRGAMHGASDPPASESPPAREILRAAHPSELSLSPRKNKKMESTADMDHTPRLGGRNLFLDDFRFDDSAPSANGATTLTSGSRSGRMVNFGHSAEELPLMPLPALHPNANCIAAI